MQWEHVYALSLAVFAIALLAFEKAHLIVIGIGLMIAVTVIPNVTIGIAVSGFANTAVVTVGALYVVGEGFLRTGAASILASKILARTGGNESTVVFLVMIMAAVLSAFVNNTLVVVTFMPVITSICKDTGLFPSRLLIPLSYACIVGGMCTLVGTSTNLLVSGVLEDLNQPSIYPALSMFEMSLPGLLIAGVAMLYIGFIGRFLLPRIPSLAAQPGAEQVREYVTEVTVREGSPLIGEHVADVGATGSGSKARASMLVRAERVYRPRFGNLKIKAGDIVVLSGRVDELASLHHETSHADASDRYRPSTMSFFELAVTHDSTMTGQPVRELQLKQRHGAAVIGMMRNGHHLQERFGELRLRTGDVLLAFGNDQARESIRNSADYHLIEGVAEKIFNRDKVPYSIAIILTVVTLFITRGAHSCTAALLGAFLMVITGCVSISQAIRSINWPILIFIVGTIGLSRALEISGTSKLIGEGLATMLSGADPIVLLGAVYVATILFTELVSNNAVAVLMTPVALAAARAAELDHRALVMAVVFGASSSFANPIGYTTNLLVYGPGGYSFMHYVRVGLGLDVLTAIVGISVIPWFWPLQ